MNARESSVPQGLAFLAETDREGPVTVIDLVKFYTDGEEICDTYDALATASIVTC